MKTIATLCGAVALLAAGMAPAWAGDGAAAIMERQALMKLIGANVGAIKQAIDSKDAARMKGAEGSARAIGFAAGAIPTMFPAGSDMKAGKTSALEKVWTDPAGFKKASDAMGPLAAALGDALKAGDAAAAMTAFAALGKDGCGGCHGPYRARAN